MPGVWNNVVLREDSLNENFDQKQDAEAKIMSFLKELKTVRLPMDLSQLGDFSRK